MLILEGEWLVASTNQGSARKVIALPVLETASPTARATRVRFLTSRK
jgi:hypothetical protein